MCVVSKASVVFSEAAECCTQYVSGLQQLAPQGWCSIYGKCQAKKGDGNKK